MDIRHQAVVGAARPERGLSVAPLRGRTGLKLSGEVSLATRADWERALERALREGGRMYRLELSAVTFVDVAGAGALAAAAQTLQDGRRLVLHEPPHTLCRLLDLFWPDLPTIEVMTS
ncbi:STAS domain-containing protein [Streptomyces sp. NPDC050523]|uniref:STAS domain-containing protein n=1 Tax=Streptomyces sp. NPDC050523 TaxID=3365622 RepID=UPI003787A6A2